MTRNRTLAGAGSFILALLTAVGSPALGRPVEEIPRVRMENLAAPQRNFDVAGRSTPGLLGAASGPDTVYFGGTFWNPDSSRWEALRDSCWTFDSGVGSHFDHGAPNVDPFKDTTLHAAMEGWIGVDRTLKDTQYFRRVTNSDFPGTGQSACKLNGSAFFWCGVFPDEATKLCYAGGQGYGNNWSVCIEQTFAYNGSGSVSLSYEYENDTEQYFDFSYVYVDTSGNGDDVEVAAYTGTLAALETLMLTTGTSLPFTAGPITVKFCVESDASYSDEDGLFTTNCGAFALDDVSLSGGGISYSTDFETGDDGWALSPVQPGIGGDWSNIVDVSDLPPALTDCVCNFADSVLVFENLAGPGAHTVGQNNFAASPWIDLLDAGLVGAPGKFVEMDMYADMPLLNYVYSQFLVRWYPYNCAGGVEVSPWVTDGVTHFFGGIPTCTQEGAPFRVDLSAIIDSGAEQVQVGLGIFSSCLYFPNCSGLTNTTPWYDNVKFGVCGTFGGGSPTTPVLSARDIDLPQDSFPDDGTLLIGSPGRLDSGTVRGAIEPGPGTSLGDTLVVLGGSGGAEVFVQFAVDPGPGVDGTDLSNFLSQVSFEETRYGLDWYSAQMDTAELGGVPSPGYWMTAFHEDDPAFTGSDTDTDPNDLDPMGGATRLGNDIFPDDVFTPGTHVNLFYKTHFTGSPEWRTLPDTTDGSYLEMEVLPSSFDGSSTFNCVLYVDHFDGRGAQGPIETSLATLLPGGSPNWENTAWDRYDVRAPSSHQATFGRPSGTEYGATLGQALAYRTIIWNSGDLDASNLVDEDAAVIKPWLLLVETQNTLYLSGDGIAASITAEAGTDPGALDLLDNYAGVQLGCGTFRDLDCPTGSPQDLTVCVNLDPVVGAVVATRPQGGTPQGQGNACPLNRSFDVLGLAPSPTWGIPVGDEEYNGGAKTAQFASISSDCTLSLFRTVVDGISVHHRRNSGNCLHGSVTTGGTEERLEEVLTWFGAVGNLPSCMDPGTPTGVGDDPPPRPTVQTALANFSPNPLRGHRHGRIEFTMAREAPARVDIYDLNGRLVKTVFDGVASLGVNHASWDATDAAGRRVAGGVYFYSLTTGGERFAKKLILALD